MLRNVFVLLGLNRYMYMSKYSLKGLLPCCQKCVPCVLSHTWTITVSVHYMWTVRRQQDNYDHFVVPSCFKCTILRNCSWCIHYRCPMLFFVLSVYVCRTFFLKFEWHLKCFVYKCNKLLSFTHAQHHLFICSCC